MKGAARQVLLPALALLLGAALVLLGTGAVLAGSMPPWRDSVGDVNHTEKITGTYLVEQSAAREDTLLIFGSSELRTTEIPTRPISSPGSGRASRWTSSAGAPASP